MDELPKYEANYVPLTPLTFLKRASKVYASRTSIVHEGTRFTWRQTYERCCSLASSLKSLNVVKNDVVSVLAPNIPAMYEMHFSVPMAGAILNTINTRLDSNNIAAILRHSEAKFFFVDYQFVPKAIESFQLLRSHAASGSAAAPAAIVIDDIEFPTGTRFGELEYEQLVRDGNPGYVPEEIQDEWEAISLNYTSGTTSQPKGVVYSHRGAYLSTLSLILGWEMGTEPVYLRSLPMFHCNGWTFTWGVAARGGTNVCLRNTNACDIYRNISLHKVTHMCAAPVVLRILLEAKPEEGRQIASPVQLLTGGAPPPAGLLEKLEPLGFRITHAYGLTEATGPALVCEWQAKWNWLPSYHRAKLKARQGICILTLEDVDIKDPNTMISVPRDGMTIGEIVLKGSSVMKGYYKNPEATSKAFKGGWFATGDVGVIHTNGYLEIKDRSKDVIISGGENISSVQVESLLCAHPSIVEAAVVAMPHPRWGESPCAFITLKKNPNGKTDHNVTETDIIAYCRNTLPHFMVPKKVKFLDDIPKSNGKFLKVQLRAMAKTLVASGHDSLADKIPKSGKLESGNHVVKRSSSRL